MISFKLFLDATEQRSCGAARWGQRAPGPRGLRRPKVSAEVMLGARQAGGPRRRVWEPNGLSRLERAAAPHCALLPAAHARVHASGQPAASPRPVAEISAIRVRPRRFGRFHRQALQSARRNQRIYGGVPGAKRCLMSLSSPSDAVPAHTQCLPGAAPPPPRAAEPSRQSAACLISSRDK